VKKDFDQYCVTTYNVMKYVGEKLWQVEIMPNTNDSFLLSEMTSELTILRIWYN